MPYRIDRGSELQEPKRREDGTLHAEGVVAKPGVLTYRTDDGDEVKELVPPTTLEDEEWLSSLARQVVTEEHPENPVDPENVRKHQVGDTGTDVVYDDGYCRVRMAVRDSDAIESVDSGEREELSPGYHCDVKDKFELDSGLVDKLESEYGDFDRIQLNRRANHVAITEAARAGSDVRLRTDADEEILIEYRGDATPDNVTDLPLAGRDTEWNANEARESLQGFYDFDPAEDPTPDPYGDNFAARPRKGTDDYDSVSSFWGPFVDIIDGDRKVVPEAIIALQNAVQGARNEPDLPGDTDVEDVKTNVVNPLWDKAWNKFGPEKWPDKKPVWNRDDGGDGAERDDETHTLRSVLRGHIAELEAGEADVVGAVAEQADINEAGVWKYLTGAVSENADPGVIEAFANVLQVDAKEILRASGLEGKISELSTTNDGDEPMSIEKIIDALEQFEELEQRVDSLRGDQEAEQSVELPEGFEELFGQAQSALEEIAPQLEEMKKQKQAMEERIQELQGKVQGLTGGEMPSGETGGESDEGPGGGVQGASEDDEDPETAAGEDSEQADSESADDDEDEERKDDSRFDSAEDRRDYLRERDEIQKAAEAFRIDAAPGDTNLELKRRIATEFTGEDYSDEPKPKVNGVFEVAKNQAQQPNRRRADAQAREAVRQRGSGSSRRRDGIPSEDEAQKEFRERWKNGEDAAAE